MRYWLLKSEPGTYSIACLERDGHTEWDGVRNFQARNFMRDQMAVGDGVLFYHSNADPPGVAGLARVSAPAHPDLAALDPQSRYFDPRATAAEPIWACVDVAFVERFPRVVGIEELKANPRTSGLEALRRGNRLSVTPVTAAQYEEVVRLGRSGGEGAAPAKPAGVARKPAAKRPAKAAGAAKKAATRKPAKRAGARKGRDED